jgi:hypothetical protein
MALNDELHSWKEIANYLQVTVRTAQKWENTRRLPVRRLPGGRGRIQANISELERWKLSGDCSNHSNPVSPQSTATPVTSKKRRWRPVAIVITLSIPALIFAYWLWSRPGQPTDWRLEGGTLVVSDRRNHELWRWDDGYAFDSDLTPDSNRKLAFIHQEDLDGDGNIETLVAPVPDGDVRELGRSIPLVCLDKNRKVKWRFTPGQGVSTVRDTFPNQYMVKNFLVAPMGVGRPKSILVCSAQIPDYPCQIALLDVGTGVPIREYWHSGHIGDFVATMKLWDLDRNGVSEIYLAGVNNASNCRTLVVLDPDRFEGASYEQNRDYQLQGFPTGRELHRVVFPRICLDFGNVIGGFDLLSFNPEGLYVSISGGSPDPSWSLDYYFSSAWRFIRMSTSSQFLAAHERAYLEGQVDHAWTPAEQQAIEKAVRAQDHAPSQILNQPKR